MNALYELLADIVLASHAGFVLFVVIGQALILGGWARGWRWARNFWFRLSHLVAIGVVVLQSWLGVWCPLTILESELRRRAGEEGYELSFIATCVQRYLFYEAPEWVFTLCYTLFGILAVMSFLLYRPAKRNRSGTASPGDLPNA